MKTTTCPKCSGPIFVSLADLLPSMYPHRLDCETCGARSRMAYPWTFSAHFFTFALGAVLAANLIGVESSKVAFVGVMGLTYVFGSMVINWLYFKSGKPLVA